jgi:hypothetical protein
MYGCRPISACAGVRGVVSGVIGVIGVVDGAGEIRPDRNPFVRLARKDVGAEFCLTVGIFCVVSLVQQLFCSRRRLKPMFKRAATSSITLTVGESYLSPLWGGEKNNTTYKERTHRWNGAPP